MALGNDSTDFGTDIALLTDLAPVWGLTTGLTNLACALVRRLSTPRGTLFYDLDYGFDVTALLNASLGPNDIASIRSGIGSELRKDPRVQSAAVTLVFTAASKTLQIAITVQTASGPFDLVLAASPEVVTLISAAAA